MTSDLSERLREPISSTELERRWAAVRKAMQAQGIDCLVTQQANTMFGHYGRYLTDIFHDGFGHPMTVIFGATEAMTIISHGAAGSKMGAATPPAFMRSSCEIRTRLVAPFVVSCHYTGTYDAELAVRDLRERRVKRVGLLGLPVMSAAFHGHLVANLHGVEFVDFSEAMDAIQALKSEEELALIRKCAAIQDTLWTEALNLIEPGRKEWEISSRLREVAVALGSEYQWFMVGSAQPGQPSTMKPPFYQHRTLRPGDQVTVLIEVSGPGGFYCELSRNASLGPVPDEVAEGWKVAVEAQRVTASRLVPGAKPAEVLAAHNELMLARGSDLETRIYAHGVGYNMIERPLVRNDDTLPIARNMAMSIHPKGGGANVFTNCCDAFVITERGAERIHQTPQEIFVI